MQMTFGILPIESSPGAIHSFPNFEMGWVRGGSRILQRGVCVCGGGGLDVCY